MKKRRFVITCVIILIVFALIAILHSCYGEKNETVYSTTIKSDGGHYALFKTTECQKYFEFLENFDETKYEIVDISTSMMGRWNQTDEFYMVTYKIIK